MALFGLGRNKKDEQKAPACTCSCDSSANEVDNTATECCPDLKEGEVRYWVQAASPVTSSTRTQSRR